MQDELVISGEHMRTNREALFVLEYFHDFSIDWVRPGRAGTRKVKRKEWLHLAAGSRAKKVNSLRPVGAHQPANHVT
jgi:hypothetical protein